MISFNLSRSLFFTSREHDIANKEAYEYSVRPCHFWRDNFEFPVWLF